MMNVFRRVMILVWLGVVLLGFRAHAQTANGSIGGIVTDPSGALIPKASVKVLNQDTGTVRTTDSSDAGLYYVPSVAAGTYTVSVDVQGFAPYEVKNVIVTVASETTANLNLAVASGSQTITVSDAPPTVQTNTAEVSTVMQAEAIAQVPLNARDLQSLAAIQPGVNKTTTFQYGPEELSISGSRPDQNQYRQEGINTVLTSLGIAPANAVGVQLGVEAVKEFAVIGGNFSPEYGGAGGVVNLLFKSGTNQLHGSAYEYFRNSALDAQSPFSVEKTPPPFTRNQFGASVGGPIIKDKAFYFVNYEGLLQDLSNVQIAEFPDAMARGVGTPGNVAYMTCAVLGSIPACTGQSPGTYEPVPTPTAQTAYALGIQQVFFHPQNSYAQLIPDCAATSPEVLTASGYRSGSCQQVETPNQHTSDNYIVGKVDYVLSARNSLSSSYNFERTQTNSPGPNPNFYELDGYHKNIFTLQDTEVLTEHLVNSARFGLNRSWWRDLNTLSIDADPRLYVASGYTVDGHPLAPTMSITGITGISYGGLSSRSPNTPKTVGYTRPDFTDDVSYEHAKHVINWGGEYSYWQENLNTPGSPSKCTCQFSSEESWLEGGPATVAQLLVPTSGNFTQQQFGKTWLEQLAALYMNDTYRIVPRLTLTMGVRWEFQATPRESKNLTSNLYNPTPEAAVTATTGQPLYNSQKDLFAPRLGINWDPTGKGRASLRAGAGVFYNEISLFDFVPYESSWAPLYNNIQLASKFLYPAPTPAATLAEFTGGPAEFQGTMPPNPATPRKYGYNVEYQQALPMKLTMLLAYVGSESHHLVRPMQWSDYYPIVQAPGSNAGCGLDQPGGVAPASCGCPATAGSAYTVHGQCFFWPGDALAKASCTVNPGPVTVGTYPCPASTSNFGLILGNLYDANADYNAFQFALERTAHDNVTMRLNYTHASCMADSDGAQTATAGNGGNSPYYFRDVQSGHSRCSYNAEDTINFAFSYAVPKAFAHDHAVMRAVLGGWTYSELTTVQSGIPFEITAGANISRNTISGAGNDRPNMATGCTRANAVNHGSFTDYIKPTCFTPAAYGYLGDMNPMALTGPGLFDTDMSVRRHFGLGGSRDLELRIDAFNTFNRPNLGVPVQTNATIFTNAGTSAAPNLEYNPALGQILQTVTTQREFQFSGRFAF